VFTRIPFAIAFCLLTALSSSVMSAATVAAAPEDVLASKGLTKFGSYYVLDADLKLADSLRTTRELGVKYNNAKKRHAALERGLNEAVALLEDLNAQNEKQTSVLDHISKSAVGTYNHQVGVVNAIRANVRQCVQIGKQRESAFKADPEPSDTEYAAAVVDLSNTMEKTLQQYAQLAADPAVKSALQILSQAEVPAPKLGPSPRFMEQLPMTRHLRDTVAPTVVHLDSIGGVPEVPVTINDSVKEDMVLESTAPYCTITADVAAKLGIQPTASDPVAHVSAGGQMFDARVVVLKSVQLGDFTATNVPCAVLPAAAKSARNILGKSLMHLFTYHLDLPNGTLHLSPAATPTANSSASVPPSPALPAP
jgi:hypothetical protein